MVPDPMLTRQPAPAPAAIAAAMVASSASNKPSRGPRTVTLASGSNFEHQVRQIAIVIGEKLRGGIGEHHGWAGLPMGFDLIQRVTPTRRGSRRPSATGSLVRRLEGIEDLPVTPVGIFQQPRS